MITKLELKQIMPSIGDRLDVFIDPINDTMTMFDINTPDRMAAFLAQLAHESGEFRYMRELADGRLGRRRELREDRAPRRVGQGLERRVEPRGRGGARIVNHVVNYYSG